MPYTYAPLVRKLLPEFEDARRAMELANQVKNPDPRPMLHILSRLQEADLKFMGHTQTRKLAVQGFEWRIAPSDPKSKAAVDIAEKVRSRFILSGLPDKLGVLLGAVFYGVAAIKAVWDEGGNGERIARTETLSSLSLMTKQGRPVLIRDTSKIETEELEPREQFIVTVHNPFEESRPDYMGGIFRTALWLILIKQFNWHDWARFNETFAIPSRWASYPAGATEEEKAIALKAAQSFGSEFYAAVPEGIKLAFVEAVKTGTVSAFKDLVATVDEALAILVLGQTLTSEVGDRGSFAAARVHDTVRADYMWHDLQMVQRAINEQYIAQDFRVNHGQDVSTRPTFEFVTDDTPDFEKNARIIADLKPVGVMFKKAEVYEKTGFSVPEEGDELL